MITLPNKHYSGHYNLQGHRGRGDQEHLEKRSGERNVDSRFQVQLEKWKAAAQIELDGDK